MFKVSNKGTRTPILLTLFTPCSSVSIVNFEQVNACWVPSSKKVMQNTCGFVHLGLVTGILRTTYLN